MRDACYVELAHSLTVIVLDETSLQRGATVTHVLPSEVEANERLASVSELFRENGAGDPD